MTETRLSNLIQQFPELEPDASIWANISRRIAPRPKVPNPWFSVAFAAAVLTVAAVPMITHQVEPLLPESVVILAELVEETEQMKEQVRQKVLFEEALDLESRPSELTLITRVDELDEQVYSSSSLDIEKRQELLERQLNTLRSLNRLQQESSPLVRRVSF